MSRQWAVLVLALALIGGATAANETNETIEDDGCCSHSYIDYYDYPIYIIGELGDNVTLECNNTVTPTPPGDAIPVSWMMPDLSIMPNNYSDDKVDVSEDGNIIIIYDVRQDDFGLYHCMMKYRDGNNWWLVKIGINTEGPYYENLWEKYQLNTVIGLSAFFGWLLLCFSIWIIWYFRWQPDYEADSYLDTYTGMRIDGEINKAYGDDEKGAVTLTVVTKNPNHPSGYVPSPDKPPFENGAPVYPESVEVYTGSDDVEVTAF